MTKELERKLLETEIAVDFYRRNLISSQNLRKILIDLYNLIEVQEEEKGRSVKSLKTKE